MTDAEPATAVSCALCGIGADPPPMTWMTDWDAARGTLHYCDRCARDNLRAVEAKLPQEWW